jgi:small nuclear ribonucleoprotein (snRNP)-like protein
MPDIFRRYPELRTVIVNLRSGTAFRGVVWRRTGPFVVIRNAEMLQDRGQVERHSLDGEVVVKMADIDFIQVVT